MKILNTIISLVIGAGVGSGVTYYSMTRPGTTTGIIFPTEQATTTGGTDKYEFRWYGKPTNQYWGGNYTIMKPDSPMEIVNISKSPHIVKIQLPKKSVVAAGGYVQDIKIFRNGKECGKTGIIGENIPLNKSCTPEL